MSNPEPDVETCSLSEYRYFLEERVLEEELRAGNLYTFMSKAILGAEAIRCPAIVQALEKNSGLHVARFSLLSQDLKPVQPYKGFISNGLLSAPGSEHNMVNASYFRDSGLVDAGDSSNTKISETVRRRFTTRNPSRVLSPA